MTPAESTVYAVDDDPAVLRGLERLLRSAGFRTEVFASAQAFLDAYRGDITGCVILDLAMPGLDGLQIQRRLAELGGALPIIFLTGHADVPTSVRAMKQGAADFLTKPVDDQVLLTAVQLATQRCGVALRERREIAEIERRLATLTRREREVLSHVLAGELNKQIAASLGTVEKTIKVHRASIMRKMRAPSLAALVRLAHRAGVERARAAGDSAG